MKAKFKMGDLVSVNDKYLMEGHAYFGKTLRHRKFQGRIIKVHENTNNQQDGFGNIWQNVYEFKGGISFCETFLNLLERGTANAAE